ncbi:MAG: hypothetical protein WBW80_12905 [Acidimicrobiales bacterium]
MKSPGDQPGLFVLPGVICPDGVFCPDTVCGLSARTPLVAPVQQVTALA